MNGRCAIALIVLVGALGCQSREKLAELELACDGGDGKSCMELGNRSQYSADPRTMLAAYEKACEKNISEGCYRLGRYWRIDHHNGESTDPAKAAKFLKKGCDNRMPEACAELASLYHSGQGSVARNRRKAADFYQRACDEGVGQACHTLANMYRKGDGIRSDLRKSAGLFERACDRGLASSCVLLAEDHFLGWGVPRDLNKGISLLEVACGKNDPVACGTLRYPRPVGGGTERGTLRAWKEMMANTSPFEILDKDDEHKDAVPRLRRFREGYARIETRDADPELRRYLEDWQAWADDAILHFEEEGLRRRRAGDLQIFTVPIAIAMEKNDEGERDGSSVRRGLNKGIDASHTLTNKDQSARNAQALRGRFDELDGRLDPLALRLEMTYGTFLPPPKKSSVTK